MTVADRASGLVSLAQRQADRLLSPSTRREAWDKTLDFASRRPAVFTFLAILSTVFLPPILVFTTFVSSVSLVVLGAGILFTFFWIGVGLLFLVPTLFVASGIAIFLWAWTVTAFVIAQSIARLLGWELASNGQLRQRENKVGPFAGVDGKVSRALEFDGKHLSISGAVDGKAAGAAYKKEVEDEVNGYTPSMDEKPTHDQKPAIGGQPVWAPGTDTALAHSTPARVQTPGGS